MSTPEPIGRQLVWAAKSVRRCFEGHLRAAGGTLSTWGVLSALELFHWRTQHDLARSLQIEGATLTRHLDRLEAEGLVRRDRDPEDRRAVHVEATPEGKEAYERMLSAAMRADQEIRAALSERELCVLRRLLTKIRESLDAGQDAQPGDGKGMA